MLFQKIALIVSRSTLFFWRKIMTDYHLIISRLLYEVLRPIALQLNMTVNRLIRIFIYLSIDHIDFLYQDYGRQNRSIYEKVNAGGTKHIHVWLTRDSYEQLKWLHGNYNNFSVAQLVRRCIFFMLKMIAEYGSLNAAMEALRRLDEVTREFQESRDSHGFMSRRPGIRHLTTGEYVSYAVIAEFIETLRNWLHSPLLIE